MTRSDFAFFHRLQVRWAEVDAQAVVFNANYLTYLDTTVSGYWRRLALPWGSFPTAPLGELSVRRVTLEFHAPARLNDWLDVGLRCVRTERSSITLQGAVFCADRMLVTGTLDHVLVAAGDERAQALPEVLPSLLRAFDAGESVLQTRVGSWPELGQHARMVREAVFVREQGIAQEDEWDAADADALHVVAFNGLGQAVATGRLLPQDDAGDAVAHVGRVAVRRPLRGAGHGQAVMAALEQVAAARGVRALQLNAQQSAAAFYRRLGYVAEGSPFDEVGIAHISMRKSIGG